ncbi:MAG: methylamine utilization protein MauG, partial [Gammaproteobacteria bacterium]|nr:methylamine utilization protein MauG [Gammaproteobacteria bacterium]
MNHILVLVALLVMTNQALAFNGHKERRLGQALFSDLNLSLNRNQSCASCHSLSRLQVPTEVKTNAFKTKKQPAKGFVDPANVQNGTAVANGSIDRTFGQLNPPSIGYAAFSPTFHFDGELFIGGQFWNGRAKNLVEQAKQPFLNPVEMAMPDKISVIARLKENNSYVHKFNRLYGIDLRQIQAGDAEVDTAFEAMASAIASFERSRLFNKFNSKFDYEAAGITAYNSAEQRGADLFDGAAQCGACHTTEGITGDGSPALLTDFSYDNLGVPANHQIPGMPNSDPGLLGNPHLEVVRGGPSSIEEVEGRQKVMSLRNIALTAPYMHNGVFKTLKEVV